VARTRSRRRRQNLILTIAVVATIFALVLVRDVSRIAAQSTGDQSIVNRNFAVLAAGIINDQNQLSQSALSLLVHGGTLSREAIAGQLAQLDLSAEQIDQRAAILNRPVVDVNAQAVLIAVTHTHVEALRDLVASIDAALSVPGPTNTKRSLESWQHQAVTADANWQVVRSRLRAAPGHVRVPRAKFALATTPLANDINQLASSPSLTLHRQIDFAAVGVTPAPFPAGAGKLVLPPTHRLIVGVSVRNREYVNQTVRVTVVVTPKGKAPLSESSSTRLSPLGATAMVLPTFRVTPGEQAIVKISLTGAPVVSSGGAERTYVLTVAPSPSS
jgi:hypothetical protein